MAIELPAPYRISPNLWLTMANHLLVRITRQGGGGLILTLEAASIFTDACLEAVKAQAYYENPSRASRNPAQSGERLSQLSIGELGQLLIRIGAGGGRMIECDLATDEITFFLNAADGVI
jgi:hypothetical protein